MAKKNQKSESVESTVSAGQALFNSLAGQTVVKELDGMWAKEPGACIVGKISHVFSYRPKRPGPDGTRREVIGLAFMTTQPCQATQDGETYDFPAGYLVGVTLSSKLQELLQYAIGSELAILAEREIDLGSGQSCWQYQVKLISGKKNPRGSDLRPTATATGDELPEPEPTEADDASAPIS